MASTSEHGVVAQTGIASLQASLVPPVQFLGFWMAVIAPFVLLGLIVAGGAAQSPLTMTGVLAANVVGLVLGNDYKQ